MGNFHWRIGLSFLFLFLLFTTLVLAKGNVHYVFLTFIALLIHEFTHMLCSELLGYPVQDLTLSPMGGCLKIDPSFILNPQAEWIIALAGPLANLMMAGGSLYLGFLGIHNQFLTDWLRINVLIGTVNLIPAQPLDGGRMLHAVLNKNIGLKNSYRIVKATTIIIDLLFLIIGFSRLYTGQTGILYIVIGAFLLFQLFFFKMPSFNLILKTLQHKKRRLSSKGFLQIRTIFVEPTSPVRLPLQYYGTNDYLLFFSLDSNQNMNIISEEMAWDSILNQGYDVTFNMINKNAPSNRYCRILSDEIE
jgi:stage IV sporulation protein FB